MKNRNIEGKNEAGSQGWVDGGGGGRLLTEERLGWASPCQSSRQLRCQWYLGESARVSLDWVGRSRADIDQSDQVTEKVADRYSDMNSIH